MPLQGGQLPSSPRQSRLAGAVSVLPLTLSAANHTSPFAKPDESDSYLLCRLTIGSIKNTNKLEHEPQEVMVDDNVGGLMMRYAGAG